MASLRRNLAWIACLWLCTQFAVLTAAPVSLCTTAPAAAADEVTCTCTHGPDANCPMHHHRAPSKSSDCKCRGTSPASNTTVVPILLDQAGILTSPSIDIGRPDASPLVVGSHTVAANWIAVPDGPPPRA